jgi:hypothetical protein
MTTTKDEQVTAAERQLKAMREIVAALTPLTPRARERVLRFVWDKIEEAEEHDAR